MAKPRSDEQHNTILDAATAIIVANCSFLSCFETQAELFNQLCLGIEREMTATATQDFPVQ